MRFWMRRLSSGSVTSVQSSVFLVLDEGLSFLEMEDDECLDDDDLDDILEGSVSVSEPDLAVEADLLPFFLPWLFPERVEGRGCLLCLGVEW
jgi:hypothetical protein